MPRRRLTAPAQAGAQLFMTKEQETIKILKRGGVAVIPTDTIYGLVAKTNLAQAVNKVFSLKKRSKNKSCIILISQQTDLKKFGIKIDRNISQILKLVWPGPVSVVLPCGNKTLAFRLPRSNKLLNILKHTGPLIAPSANLEGRPPAKNIAEAKKYFGNKVDAYLPGGTKIGQASTLIQIESGKVKILRPGKLPKAVLQYLASWLLTMTLPS